MIRFIVQLILVVAFSYGAQFIMPWWGVIIASALAGMIVNTKPFSAFLSGFIGLGALWFFLAYTIDAANHSLLSGKVATILGLDAGFQLILITTFLGAIIGGSSALTGNYFISIFKKTKINRSPYH